VLASSVVDSGFMQGSPNQERWVKFSHYIRWSPDRSNQIL